MTTDTIQKNTNINHAITSVATEILKETRLTCRKVINYIPEDHDNPEGDYYLIQNYFSSSWISEGVHIHTLVNTSPTKRTVSEEDSLQSNQCNIYTYRDPYNKQKQQYCFVNQRPQDELSRVQKEIINLLKEVKKLSNTYYHDTQYQNRCIEKIKATIVQLNEHSSELYCNMAIDKLRTLRSSIKDPSIHSLNQPLMTIPVKKFTITPQGEGYQFNYAHPLDISLIFVDLHQDLKASINSYKSNRSGFRWFFGWIFRNGYLTNQKYNMASGFADKIQNLNSQDMSASSMNINKVENLLNAYRQAVTTLIDNNSITVSTHRYGRFFSDNLHKTCMGMLTSIDNAHEKIEKECKTISPIG